MVEALKDFARDHPGRYGAAVIACACVAVFAGNTTFGDLGAVWFGLLVLVPNMTQARDHPWRYVAAIVGSAIILGLAVKNMLDATGIEFVLLVLGPAVVAGLVSWHDVHKARPARA